ncbi:lysylphosphatidylglycerol synthase transmembrane domain-containing protein [Halosimplex pelagicum]|uniref:Flippase-like domain-containing protein n=1 Tax=Halosimplex pelagicum TaxID=869886 RepID=A0A7D5P8K2_9EURY|nr:lysylphosphatidylglycerol synthase transmembrane domain-containing protein [Halosimplex pelagicum]QLH80485.1 flippase-like domain-containing protein [Halosimplex pelagicum]
MDDTHDRERRHGSDRSRERDERRDPEEGRDRRRERRETAEDAAGGIDRRSVAKVGVGFGVAVVLLYLFGRVIGWSEITRTFARADPRWLALAMASSAAGLAVWAKVWDELLELVGVDVAYPPLVVTYFAATFGDYVTPLGKAGGGPLIAYVLSADDRISYEQGLASVTSADTINLLPYVGFALVGFGGLTLGGGLPRRANLLAGTLVAVVGTVAVTGAVVWRKRDRVEDTVVGVVERVGDLLPFVDFDSVRETVRGFYDEIERIAAEPRTLAYALALSTVGWVLFALPLYLAGLTVNVELGLFVVAFVVPASTVAGLVPTPGGLGGVEFALVGLLVALTTVPASTAAAIALVYRLASYWLVVAVGGLAALYEIYGA